MCALLYFRCVRYGILIERLLFQVVSCVPGGFLLAESRGLASSIGRLLWRKPKLMFGEAAAKNDPQPTLNFCFNIRLCHHFNSLSNPSPCPCLPNRTAGLAIGPTMDAPFLLQVMSVTGGIQRASVEVLSLPHRAIDWPRESNIPGSALGTQSHV